MKNHFIFNSKTTGNYREELLNGRNHIVVNFKAMQGDTVMNKILYPMSEVESVLNSFKGIKMPLSHTNLPADHPISINSNYIGAFCRNARLDRKSVIGEMWVDEEYALKNNGEEVINRIKNGGKIGVSTGGKAKLKEATGTGEDGRAYDKIANGFKLDHVAILLDEKPAGEHVETIVFNTEANIDEVITPNGDDNTNQGGEKLKLEEIIAMLGEFTAEEKIALIKATMEMLNDEEKMAIVENFKGEKVMIDKADVEVLNSLKAEKEAELNTLREEVKSSTGLTDAEIQVMSKETLDKLKVFTVKNTEGPQVVQNRALQGVKSTPEQKFKKSYI